MLERVMPGTTASLPSLPACVVAAPRICRRHEKMFHNPAAAAATIFFQPSRRPAPKRPQPFRNPRQISSSHAAYAVVGQRQVAYFLGFRGQCPGLCLGLA